MGMGFQSISVYDAPPPVQNLISEHALTEPMFAFKLASSGSELYLGGVNHKLYKGEFTWIDVTKAVCQILKYLLM
jgi:cathepsin D